MKPLRIFLLGLIFIFGITSCDPSKNLTLEKGAGTYIHYGGNYNSTLDLFKDGCYSYESFTVGGGCFPGIQYEESKGSWNVDSGLIYLSSYRVLDTAKPSYQIVDAEYSGGDSLLVVVLDTNSETMPFVNCVVFDGDTLITGASTDFDGKAVLNISQGDRIEFSFAGMTTVIFPLENKRPSKLVLRMRDSSFAFYRYFSNEAWRFKGRKLVDPTSGFYFYKKWPTPAYHYE